MYVSILFTAIGTAIGYGMSISGGEPKGIAIGAAVGVKLAFVWNYLDGI